MTGPGGSGAAPGIGAAGGISGPDAAVVLAGGRGRRLGGLDKPALQVGDRTLLRIALDAVGDCSVVVVGPARELPRGVLAAREDPPGGGPAAALAAGVRALPAAPPDAVVAVLAADQPGITEAVIDRLCAALVATGARSGDTTSVAREQDSPDGAVLVDPGGRRQYLTGVWRFGVLKTAVDSREQWHGVALRELLSPIRTIDVAGSERETADVDTPADWQRWQS